MSVRGSDGGLPEYAPSSIPVYVGETVGDFCARLTGLPADDEGVEVLWGTILLPNAELFGALTTTKPWQIDFEGGKERLVLRALRVEPVEGDDEEDEGEGGAGGGGNSALETSCLNRKGYPLSWPRKVARIRDMKTKERG